jgi:cytochrome c553
MKKIAIIATVVALSSASLFAAMDGQALTRKCVGCHGLSFEKAPLGRSAHVVKGESYSKIVKMIKYYQHPKESDEMIMKTQVKNLTDAQIKTIAKYISSLK